MMYFATLEYITPSNTKMPKATYRGEVLQLEQYPLWGYMKLYHLTSSSWEKEKGYHSRTITIHMPTGYVVGMGTIPECKSQIKILDNMRFEHKGNGLFISDVNPRYKIQSHNMVASDAEKASKLRNKQKRYIDTLMAEKG